MSTRRTNDTFTATERSVLGDEFQVRTDHGAVYVEIRGANTRYPATVRLSVEQAVRIFQRGAEIAAVAPSTARRG